MDNRTGHFKQDSDGHWYLVPKDKIKEFRALLDAIDGAGTPEEFDDFSVDFIERFEEYRLSGGIESYEVTING